MEKDSESEVMTSEVMEIPTVTGATSTALVDNATALVTSSTVAVGGARPKVRTSVTEETQVSSEIVSDSIQLENVRGFENIVQEASCVVVGSGLSPKQENSVNAILEYTENISLECNFREGDGEWIDDEQDKVIQQVDTLELDGVVDSAVNEGITSNYYEMIESECDYNEVVIQFTENLPIQVVVSTQATGATASDLVRSPPKDPMPAEASTRPKEGKVQHIVKTRTNRRKNNKSNKNKSIDDGKKPVTQLRIEAEEKKKVMKENGTWVEPKTEKCNKSEVIKNPVQDLLREVF